jgi:hypothetical protein
VAAGLIALAFFDRSSSPYFSDPLTGPNSPKLSIPAGKYGYTPQGLRRVQSDNLVDRPMIRTVSGAYLRATHFTFEVSAKVAADDLSFFGFGQAVRDPGYYNEPSHCFSLGIANLGSATIGATVVQVGAEEAHYLDKHELGTYVPGTTETVRIVRDGDYLTLSVPRQNIHRTYSISQYNAQLGLTNENTCLFFGSTSVGTVFSNVRVTRSATEDKTPSTGRR